VAKIKGKKQVFSSRHAVLYRIILPSGDWRWKFELSEARYLSDADLSILRFVLSEELKGWLMKVRS
jgi:hypothetical protein